MAERIPFDMEAYERLTHSGACFICGIARGEAEIRGVTHMIYEDADVLVFLNRYPTLRGYSLVCPRRHIERVVGDVELQEYLDLQTWVYRVGRAVEETVPTERLYILTLGSQQGNSHIHWHVAPCPPGLGYRDQQFAALSMSRGILAMSSEEMADLAAQIRGALLGQA